MNKNIYMGRLTRNPEVRYSQGNEPMAIARFTLAVDRRVRRQEGQQDAAPSYSDAGDGFMNIPDGIDEELPFN